MYLAETVLSPLPLQFSPTPLLPSPHPFPFLLPPSPFPSPFSPSLPPSPPLPFFLLLSPLFPSLPPSPPLSSSLLPPPFPSSSIPLPSLSHLPPLFPLTEQLHSQMVESRCVPVLIKASSSFPSHQGIQAVSFRALILLSKDGKIPQGSKVNLVCYPTMQLEI